MTQYVGLRDGTKATLLVATLVAYGVVYHPNSNVIHRFKEWLSNHQSESVTSSPPSVSLDISPMVATVATTTSSTITPNNVNVMIIPSSSASSTSTESSSSSTSRDTKSTINNVDMLIKESLSIFDNNNNQLRRRLFGDS
ncbi:hypothetical protein SAMD00019534_056620 [Acytostelium subglobosum LB1]|uniref:hypothetical protein n=1 Tax=Acytostelium subglobosum LB1 TaxID=1410327 RepID=UPI000644FA32|nr:hypothetical protein SAMD00019534_056620 [Acytostelium subglobosum LB1]GAM22487.1 hypothetical protein SAMD00019534_056620 [Acytostelium subglobosum LB1]|eukprot:XP_012754607.1 hypothetical protein SAMD00019534_056620 [Acytostelium subglobosum LB1]